MGVSNRSTDDALTNETLLRLWTKLGVPTVPAPDANLTKNHVDKKVEVRWMASGDVVCSVSSDPMACLSALEATVSEKAGIPEREQRFFQDGKELSADAPLSTINVADPVMLVRTVSDPRITDLSHFHTIKKFDELKESQFTMVRKVSQGINGDVFQYRWQNADAVDVL